MNEQPRQTYTGGVIEALLQRGEENALSAAELLNALGMSDARALRKLISDERQNGALILSGKSGYFLPAAGVAGRLEIAAYEHAMHSRAFHSMTASKAARQALKTLDGQITIYNDWS